MNMRMVQAFELYNMEKPDAYNEKITFRTLGIAQRVQARCGGDIRQTVITEKV